MGHQFHGTHVISGAGIHSFQHITGDFGLMVMVQILVDTGHRFDKPGNYQKVVADNQNGDIFIKFSQQCKKIGLTSGIVYASVRRSWVILSYSLLKTARAIEA